jgi:hypothetical protein
MTRRDSALLGDTADADRVQIVDDFGQSRLNA